MVSAPVHSVAYQFFHCPTAADGWRKCQVGVIQYFRKLGVYQVSAKRTLWVSPGATVTWPARRLESRLRPMPPARSLVP